MELPQETKQRYFELFSNAFSPSKVRPAHKAEMKAKLWDEEWIKISAKRSTMTFVIFRMLTMFIKLFQTNLNLVWNLRLAKSIFFFPNQTGIGLENRTQFLGVTFPNQTGFGLEKDTE